MKVAIHPTSVVSESAFLAADCVVGPWCVVGPGARLGAGVRLHSHVVVEGDTSLGDGTEVHPFSVLGGPAQTIPPDTQPGRLEIGAHVVIREHVTIHVGREGGCTRIGDHSTLMVGVHVAHDCTIGRHVVLVNDVGLSGHVVVGDYAQLGGKAGCHQFVRIGEHAMLGGGCHAFEDVLPFTLAVGAPARVTRLNEVGLTRAGFSDEERSRLDEAVRRLLEEPNRREHVAAELVRDFPKNSMVARLSEFASQSRRGVAGAGAGGYRVRRASADDSSDGPLQG